MATMLSRWRYYRELYGCRILKPSPLQSICRSLNHSSGRFSTLISWCPDHTKLSVQFQPWNCWRLCSELLDVGPPLFTLLQPKMPTDGVGTCRCDQPLKVHPHIAFISTTWGTISLLHWLFIDKFLMTTTYIDHESLQGYELVSKEIFGHNRWKSQCFQV